MSPADYQRRKAVFEAAMDAAPAVRESVIEELSRGDASLAADVRRLVRNAELEDSFLDSGAIPSRELQAGQLLCDRFELLRLAGEGGMGQVWAALDRRLGETVAIKTIQRGLAGETAGLARLQRELQLARRIGHPNVCRVYELFEDPATARVFLTMQLLEGETLAARLRREGRLVPAEALRLFREIAAGLAEAHAAGVVHRDLKPSNVMLTPDCSGQERAVVMDFGLARAHQPSAAGELSATQPGLVMGTFDYMAPEQMRGEPASPAADVYALGLLLFEMLDGQPPFHGRNTMDTWMRRIREGPPALAAGQRIPGLDPRVDAVIARCLEYEPAARFASPLDAVAALEGRRARLAIALPRRWQIWTAAAAALAAALFWLAPRWPRAGVPEDVRRAYEDAQRDLSEGAATRAAAELRRTIQRAPGFAAAHAALAETQLELDQAFQARESIQRAAYLAPDRSRLPEAEALHIDGVNLLILRDCAKAVETLRRRSALVEAPFRATALASLARAYERCEMAGEARKTLEQAAAADPRNAAVRVRAAFLASRNKERETAHRLLSEAETLYRERANFEGVTEVLATRGALAAERDQLDEAAAALHEALSLARTTRSAQQEVRVLLQQAIVARKRGVLADAERLTAQGLDLARRNDLETLALQGLFTAANVDSMKNEFARAEAGYQQALEIATRYRDEGNQARAWLSLASLNVRQALPGRVAEFLTLARPYYAKTGNRRVQEQIELLESSVHLSRAEFEPVLEAGQRALDLATAQEDRAKSNAALRSLRSAYEEMGRWREALAVSQRIEQAPPVDQLRDRLLEARLHAHLGQPQEALRLLAEASQGAPGRGEFAVKVAYNRALIALLTGNIGGARQMFAALTRRRDLDATTHRYVRLWDCAALTWGAQPSEAVRPCQALVQEDRAAGRNLVALLATLWLAEAQWRTGDPITSRRLATEVEQTARTWTDQSEWLWRAQRLLSSGRPGTPPAATGELDRTLTGRPDVVRWNKEILEMALRNHP